MAAGPDAKPYLLAAAMAEDGVLHIDLEGVIGRASADEIADLVMALIEEHAAKRVLIDVRRLAGRLSARHTYWHVRRYRALWPRPRVAVLDVPQHDHQFSFHQTVAQNFGYDLTWFTEPDAAAAWLR